jgi:hypothetical protein
MTTIELIVAPDGQTRLQTRGFPGASCLAASRWLEAALGRTKSDRLSSEYHAAAPVQASAQQEAR